LALRTDVRPSAPAAAAPEDTEADERIMTISPADDAPGMIFDVQPIDAAHPKPDDPVWWHDPEWDRCTWCTLTACHKHAASERKSPPREDGAVSVAGWFGEAYEWSIGPEEAAAYLAELERWPYPLHHSNIDSAFIELLADLMRSGRYVRRPSALHRVNGEWYRFDARSARSHMIQFVRVNSRLVLIDGRHRLSAIVASQTRHQMLCLVRPCGWGYARAADLVQPGWSRSLAE
jgi:hypothetical protein